MHGERTKRRAGTRPTTKAAEGGTCAWPQSPSSTRDTHARALQHTRIQSKSIDRRGQQQASIQRHIHRTQHIGTQLTDPSDRHRSAAATIPTPGASIDRSSKHPQGGGWAIWEGGRSNPRSAPARRRAGSLRSMTTIVKRSMKMIRTTTRRGILRMAPAPLNTRTHTCTTIGYGNGNGCGAAAGRRPRAPPRTFGASCRWPCEPHWPRARRRWSAWGIGRGRGRSIPGSPSSSASSQRARRWCVLAGIGVFIFGAMSWCCVVYGDGIDLPKY